MENEVENYSVAVLEETRKKDLDCELFDGQEPNVFISMLLRQAQDLSHGRCELIYRFVK